MESAVDRVKQGLLLAMYSSVERMNIHILRNEPEGVLAEQALQVNLRSNFEDLPPSESE